MEASIAIRSAVAAPDLAELVTAEGPFATVYLSTDPAVENAAQRADRAWKSVRRELEDAGAPAGALEEIGDLVPEAHLWGKALGALATGDGLAHVEVGQQPPPRDLGRWEALPSLVPILEWRQATPPHVAVLVDRTGADLFAFRSDAPNVHREVQGADDSHIRKVKPGGWSQRRFQQAAENLWEDNAEEVAGEVARLVEEVDARLVVAAGDVRALGFLREHLPQEVAELVTVTDGARQPDGSDDQLVEEVERILAVAVAQDSTSLLETFQQELGQGDRAVAGTADVLGALFRSQVEVLLVYDHLDDDRRAWFGPEPSHAASTEQTLREFGVEPQEGRLVDVAVRAALGTGARIRVVPAESGIPDGLGAVLRWS
jgi:Bacterial archaeo-eukaryotic release factor family 2